MRKRIKNAIIDHGVLSCTIANYSRARTWLIDSTITQIEYLNINSKITRLSDFEKCPTPGL